MTDPRQRAAPEADEQRKYANRLIEDISTLEDGFELTGLPGRNLAVYEQDSRMVARWLLVALDRVDALEAEVEGALTVAQHERDIAAARLESLMAAEARVDALTDGLERLAQSYGPDSAVARFCRALVASPKDTD